MPKFFVMIVIFCAVLGGSADAREPQPWITLERTACYGICPTFTVRVSLDGRVDYFGKEFVVATGARRGRLARPELARLRQMIADVDVAKLPADCCSCFDISDQPWTNLEVVDAKGTTRVRHYHGCESAPAALSDLEEAIVSATGTRRWIGSDAERARLKRRWFRQNEASRFPLP